MHQAHVFWCRFLENSQVSFIKFWIRTIIIPEDVNKVCTSSPLSSKTEENHLGKERVPAVTRILTCRAVIPSSLHLDATTRAADIATVTIHRDLPFHTLSNTV